MKPFNFAEAKIVERDFRRRYVNAKLRGIAWLGAIAVVVCAFSFVLRSAYAKPLGVARHDLAQMEMRCNEARQGILTANKGTIEQRWQEDLSRSSRQVLNIVNGMLSSVPEDVWINRIESLENGAVVRLEGCALSYTSLSEMISRLRRVPALTSVRIVSTRTIGANGAEPVDFEVRVQVKGADAPAASTASTPAPAKVPEIGGSL